MDGKAIWDKLHWFNFPDLEEREVSQDEYLQKRLLPSMNYNDHKPLYVYLYNGKINKLDGITHCEKTIKYLNGVGVTFYLNEPLCQYVAGEQDKERILRFYIELTGEEDPANLRAEELDTIRDYAIRNKLHHIRVKTCDYNVQKYFPYYNKWMTLFCEDTFVKNCVYVNVQDTSFSEKFSKKFINLNWRWTPHRNLIAAFLAESSSYVSFFHKSRLQYLSLHPWYNLEDWPKEYQDRVNKGLSYIENNGPLCLDVKFKELLDSEDCPYPVASTVDDFVDPMHPAIIEKFYRDVFCDVVTESRFAQPTANYSEKTHQPMFYKKPFVLLAPSGTLQYLREQGYKTFSKYWDESYDLCENHEERLFKIFEVIKYIESKSIEELQEMYKGMKPILLHNFNQLQNNIYDWRGHKALNTAVKNNMKDSRITIGHVGPFWSDEYQHFNYTRQPVSDEESENWIGQGYDYVKSFTGSMYDNRNPMPKWVNRFRDGFGLYKQACTFYRMNTLEIMPTHSDHYRTYMRLNDADYDDVYRVVVMLEDWKPGHYFELGGIGYVNWEAGDWFKWKGDVPHAASNIGIDPRYTLQITGVSIYTGQLNDLFCFNIPNVANIEHDHPMFRLQILPILKEHNDKPLMVNLDSGKIVKLETLEHTEDDIKEINEKGLTIHLNEPLCSYNKMDDFSLILDNKELDIRKYNRGFYSEFTKDIDYSKLRADELDSILNYVERNSLTNVTVHTGDYNVAKFYTHYTPKFNLKTDDLFLKMQKICPEIKSKPLLEGNFNKKFLCLNWRYTKHRNLAATFVSQKTSSVSWYFDVPMEVLTDNLFFDLNVWKEKHPQFYQKLIYGTEHAHKNGPLTLDSDANEKVIHTDSKHCDIWPNSTELSKGETPALYNITKNTLQDFYENIFVDVVTESRFAQPTANFSEKLLQPVQYLRPFILFAPPHTLEYFKTFGFKTFSDYWDESYDEETCHEQRIIKLFTLIDSIEEKPIEELRKMYQDMREILDHNKEVFTELVKKYDHRKGFK